MSLHDLRHKLSSLELQAKQAKATIETHVGSLLAVPRADNGSTPPSPVRRAAPPSPLSLHSPSRSSSPHRHSPHSPASPSRSHHHPAHSDHSAHQAGPPSLASPHQHTTHHAELPSPSHRYGHRAPKSPSSPRGHYHEHQSHEPSSPSRRHRHEQHQPNSPLRAHSHAHPPSPRHHSDAGKARHADDHAPSHLHERAPDQHSHHVTPSHSHSGKAGHAHSPSQHHASSHSHGRPSDQHSHLVAPSHSHHGHARSGHHRSSSHADLVLSYPPHSKRSCAGEDAAVAILEDRLSSWWHGHDMQPSALRNRSDLMWSGRMSSVGHQSSVYGMSLFIDLSMVYYCATTTPGQFSPQLEALFVPRPHSLDHAAAEHAAGLYNEHVARFAEHADASRLPVGNGECWTLASEALKAVPGDRPHPVPSLGRTHGSLVFLARPGEGQWRSAEGDGVRRGDIIEWREARVTRDDGATATLGMPDHTAVIVADAPTSRPVQHGQSLRPTDLGWLETIEQSAGKLPSRHRYDLATFDAGEMWIYRPCSLVQLGLPDDLTAAWPPPVQAYAPHA